MPSNEEAMALSGLSDFEEITQFLLDQSPGAVILTLGEGGVIYRDKNATRFDLPSFMIDVFALADVETVLTLVSPQVFT